MNMHVKSSMFKDSIILVLVRHSCPPLQVAIDRCDVDASILTI